MLTVATRTYQETRRRYGNHQQHQVGGGTSSSAMISGLADEKADDTPISFCSSVTSKAKPTTTTTTDLRQPPSLVAVDIAIASLALPPFLLYGTTMLSSIVKFFTYVRIFWESLMHFGIYPILITTFFTAFMVVLFDHHLMTAIVNRAKEFLPQKLQFGIHQFQQLRTQKKRQLVPVVFGLLVLVFFLVMELVFLQFQIVQPSWLWNPFLYFTYRVYQPNEIPVAMKEMCVDKTTHTGNDYSIDPRHRNPLCLNQLSWKTLSSGALSSRNSRDIQAVLQGIHFAKEQSGGLVINVMARDTIDSIEGLRYNVESLLPFFANKLAVVIFENDSVDGTREALKQWAKDARGYKIDLMDCGAKNPDCKFGISHRYDSLEAEDFQTSSAVGPMADYRQKIVDYVIQSPAYMSYSHMLLIDLDLKVSISPLGVLHTLGILPHEAVACSGRQPFPGTLGSIVTLYDLTAFQALEKPQNKFLHILHQKFCGLGRKGDRWRNQCEGSSPAKMMFMQEHDWLFGPEPYKVASAYNGMALYPLDLLRETEPKYDTGDDGQRCEHIGFHLSLKKPMFLNPKWTLNVDPSNPGGPKGKQALKGLSGAILDPKALFMFFQTLLSMMTVIASFMVLGLYIGHFVAITYLHHGTGGTKWVQQLMRLPLHARQHQ